MTTMLRRSSLAAMLLILSVGSVEAGTVIDFRTAPYIIGTVITNQYEGDGVVFSLETITDPTRPGPIIDSFGPVETRGLYNTYNTNTPFWADFSVAVTEVSFTSIENSPLRVRAYDSGGSQLAETTIAGGAAVGQILTSTNIARLEFLNDSGTGYFNRSDLTILQTLDFGTSVTPVPEPSTLAAGLIAVLTGAGVTWRRRRLAF